MSIASSSFPCPQIFPGRIEIRANPTLNLSNLQTCPSSRSRNFIIRSGNDRLGRTNPLGDRDGLIILDHGSRYEFVEMFRERTGYAIVEPAHMELTEPSIQHAFKLCVEKGANRVIVSPFFLLPGRHWNQDIPSLTAEAAKEHPGVTYMVTPSATCGCYE